MDSPSNSGLNFKPDLPIAISEVGNRHLIFDVKVATWLRREHRLCGTTIGTLPIAPSQNMFLGVPVEIMPEEAQLLVGRGIAVIVDDARAHDNAVRSTDRARRADYMARVEKQSMAVKQAKDQEKADSKKRGLERRSNNLDISAPLSKGGPAADLLDPDDGEAPKIDAAVPTAQDVAAPPDDSPVKILPLTATSSTYHVTPATSRLLLPASPFTSASAVKDVPPSYQLYRHLYDKGYFMTPGLRFGCQYTVYPGDPLRFHSHFLAMGTGWDEEIDLMDIVGGGRLGTGVKKGFLLGGQDPNGDVRTFSIEWAAM